MPTPLYNRTKQCFRVIQKRKEKAKEVYDDSPKECCVPELVLASITEPTITWKNDITSAWFKLDTTADTIEFKLYKQVNGVDVLATYQPTKTPVVVNPNNTDFYATIPWKTVLSTDGEGCYTYKLLWNVSGLAGTTEWGEYQLLTYSTDTAKGTIRLRAVLNQFNNIENIDFTNSKVQDTLRLNGFFGKREPTFVVDNLVYQDRKSYNVQREIINNYTLFTDPIKQKYADKIIDLYLLSEFELYASDHNPFNFSSEFKDTELIVEESPTLEYIDFTNFVKITAKLQDKKKDKLTKYNG
jgi:hypothetical protein